jgi:hypothetical protein
MCDCMSALCLWTSCKERRLCTNTSAKRCADIVPGRSLRRRHSARLQMTWRQPATTPQLRGRSWRHASECTESMRISHLSIVIDQHQLPKCTARQLTKHVRVICRKRLEAVRKQHAVLKQQLEGQFDHLDSLEAKVRSTVLSGGRAVRTHQRVRQLYTSESPGVVITRV